MTQKTTFKKGLIALVIGAQLISAGCVSTDNTGATTVTGDQMIKAAEANEAARLEEVRLTLKDEFDQHYRNGLYFEDFTDVEEQLDQELIAWLETELKKRIDVPLFVKVDVEYLNASLKKAREEDWDIEKMLYDEAIHTRKMLVEMYFFIPDTDDFSYLEGLAETLDPFIAEQAAYHNRIGKEDSDWISRFYDASELEKRTLEELKSTEKPWLQLADTDKEFYIDEDGQFCTSNTTVKKTAKKLLQKYDEEFLFIRPDDGERMYTPVKNEELWFYTGGTDKYLTVFTQKLLSDEVNRILEEEGASDTVVQLSVPTGDTMREQDMTPADTSHVTDARRFINEVFPFEYNTTLIYLLEPGEAIDYEMLQRVCIRVGDIVEEPEIYPKFVFFYELETAEEKQMLVELFKRDMITEYFYREDLNFSNLMQNINITHADTDGFHYLELYGEKKDFLLKVYSRPNPHATPEDFESVHKETSLY